ncbi:MAG: AMP-binding protein [Ignavibacteria bacterium]|nr:AMP-binding protein [Ignavibacteria bacterium]
MSIGKTIPGWNFRFNPAEDSSEKEIVIYGDYIGKGYLGQVEDTKFRIIEVERKRVNAFETGDLVTEKNGNLFFSCRKDRQIKLKRI